VYRKGFQKELIEPRMLLPPVAFIERAQRKTEHLWFLLLCVKEAVLFAGISIGYEHVVFDLLTSNTNRGESLLMVWHESVTE
jgi:hypothetical protein